MVDRRLRAAHTDTSGRFESVTDLVCAILQGVSALVLRRRPLARMSPARQQPWQLQTIVLPGAGNYMADADHWKAVALR